MNRVKKAKKSAQKRKTAAHAKRVTTKAKNGVQKPKTPSPTLTSKEERDFRAQVGGSTDQRNVRRSTRTRTASVRIGAPRSAQDASGTASPSGRGNGEPPWFSLDEDVKEYVMHVGAGVTRLLATNPAAWEYAEELKASYSMLLMSSMYDLENTENDMSDAKESCKAADTAYLVGSL